MVGVPTSKGCSLCLKRSVKCDEARPSCSQCRRGGRTCPGYARGMKFVDEGPKLRRPSRNTIRVSTGLSGTGSNSSLAADKLDAVHGQFARSLTTRGHTIYHQPTSSTLERQQILSSFVCAMFPLGAASVQKSFLGSWLWHVPPRLNCCASLDHAALSVALAYFARVSGDQLVLHNADLSYTFALKSLAIAIGDATGGLDANVLCATLLLELFESIVNRDHSWIRHAGGAARLMQLRGARRCYESAFEYSMFLACRGAIIYEALASGEPCFLDTQDWQSIPDGLIEFPLLPDSPELHHIIFRYFAAIPGLLNQVKGVTNDTPESVYLSILSSAQNLRQDIRSWHNQYISIDGGLRKQVLETLYAVSDSDDLFNSNYVYRDVMSATIITTCYACLIVLNKGIDCLQSEDSQMRENYELAQEICMSANYCSHAGYCGTQAMMFSLPIAHSVLPVKYHAWTGAWMAKFSSSLEATRIQLKQT
ncbi:uncharacterized protein AUP68_02472 [Ilyonectria robusta]